MLKSNRGIPKQILNRTLLLIKKYKRRTSKMTSCLSRAKRLRIEFPIFLIFFAFVLANTVNTNFILYRTCYVTLGYKESECALLGRNYSNNATEELEKKVQPHATGIITTSAVISAIFSPIMCFFLGPWTDIYGRKPILLATIGGIAVAFAIMLIISIIPYASPWLVVLHLIPSSLTGGIPALAAAVLCYITDTTPEESRGLRMGLFEGIIALGSVMGTTLSSFILNTGGYQTVYSICVLCAVASWVYILILVPESVQNVSTEGKFRGLFKFSLLKSAVSTTVKKREGYERSLLLIIITIMLFALFATFGTGGVMFLYLRRKFLWTLEDFTMYSSITETTGIIGAIVGIFLLNKVLHMREAIVMLFGFTSAWCGAFLQGLAQFGWQIYAGGLIKCLSGAISPMARCLLSKIIPVEDSGKVFALLLSVETISALVGVTSYTNIYNSTLDKHPEAFNFVNVGVYSFEIILVIVVLIVQKFHQRLTYLDLDNETSMTESTA